MEIRANELVCGWAIEYVFKKDFCCKSSYHVIGARLLGLSYPDYLRYCRTLGAELRGVQGYSFPVWKTSAGTEKLISQLKGELKKMEGII